jgi:hypothetical protein
LQQIISDGYTLDGYNFDGYGFAYDVCYASNPVEAFGVTLPVGPIVAYSGQSGITLYSDGYGGGKVLLPGIFAYCIAVYASSISNSIWVVYADITGGVHSINAATGASSFIDQSNSKVANIGIIEDIDDGNLNVSYELLADANSQWSHCINCIAQSNSTVSNITTQTKMGLASKPFRMGDNIFINTIFDTSLQATYFTQCVSQNWSVIAKHSPDNGGKDRSNRLLSQCDVVSGTNFLFAGQRKGPFTSYQNAQTVNFGVAGYTIDFTNSNSFNNVEANNNLHIVGGVKKIYDGISCVEDNFHLFPELKDGYGCDITLQPGGHLTYNALTQPNQYQYIVIYEWTDNYEQVQRSGPSVSNTIIVPADGYGALLTVATLPITDKRNPRSPVCISIYRTQDSLPIFYKITDDNNPLINDPSVDSVTFVDNLSDKDIAANENIYTSSQLGNSAPPACSLISLYQNRLFINQTEDQGVLWYSQNKFDQSQYNTLALDWNSSFVEGVDSRFGNAITAIGLLDQSLAIFKETAIFLLAGDGPNSLLTSGQFNDAVAVVADTGCNNANSLVFITQTPNSPGGLLFKSQKGIYLLGRDSSLTYIGAPVNKYNHLTITSASVIANKNMVVFTTLEGTCLVYNYFFNAWTTWGGGDNDGDVDLPAIDATVWNNQLVILTPAGHIMVQDMTGKVFMDSFSATVNYPVQMTITTPWLRFNGAANMQGYQAIYNCLLLGTLNAPHTLQVQVAYNYNPSVIETVLIDSTLANNRWGGLPNWGANGVWGSDQFANYQFQINFKQFRSEAIQLTFTDLDPNPTAAFSLNGLSFEVMPFPGGVRLPVGNRVGTQ